VVPIFIILDKDEEVTDLRSSDAVRVLQWPRRCMENYLIDVDVITELMKKSDIVNSPVADEGDVSTLFRELAFLQLDEIVAREVYERYDYQSPALRTPDVERRSLGDIATALYDRLSAAKSSLKFTDGAEWQRSFVADCEKRKAELISTWEAKWRELCDGKRLFSDLQRKGLLRVSAATFKRRIIQHMKDTTSENWRLVESLLKGLIGA
jgi:hypothetical protein